MNPGLENLALLEFKEKWQLAFDTAVPRYTFEEGGIEFLASFIEFEYLSHYLKIPTRILLRINHEFKVRDFPKLFTKCKNAQWISEYILEVPEVIKCTSKKSRLIHTKKIEDTIRKGLAEYFRNNPPKKKLLKKTKEYKNPILHVRIINDNCKFSLDVTGGNLYKRGERTYIGSAPLRENIAAAFIYFCNSHNQDYVCDPMCGSGSLLIEAHQFYNFINREQLSYLTIPLLQNVSETLIPLRSSLKTIPLKSVGFDICEKTLKAAKRNNMFSELCINDIWEGFPQKYNFDQIILNPPWNKRIQLDAKRKKTHADLFKTIRAQGNYSLGMILPKDINLKIFKNQPTKKLILTIGGIKTQFLYWEK
jgi:23S rRNA G2445 N2-methylase RlmL